MNTANETTYFSLFPENIRDVFLVADNIAFVASVGANSMLIMLIFMESSSKIRAYSTGLLQNCVFDLLTSAVSFVTQMQLELMNGHLVYVVGGPLSALAPSWHNAFAFFYTLTICMAVNVICVIFVFRYMLVCRGTILRRHQIFVISIFIFAYSFLESSLMARALFTHGTDRQCRDLLKGPIWRKPAVHKCALAEMTNVWFVRAMVSGVIIIIVVFTTMSVCSILVVRQLRVQRANLSQRSRKLQQQLNLMLFIQMFAPAFTCFMPAIMLISSPLLHIAVPGSGLLVSGAFSSIPCVNPIVAIVFVANFRNRLFRCFLGRARRPSTRFTISSSVP